MKNKTIINSLTDIVKLLKEKEIELQELESIIYYNNFEYYINNDKKFIVVFKNDKVLLISIDNNLYLKDYYLIKNY